MPERISYGPSRVPVFSAITHSVWRSQTYAAGAQGGIDLVGTERRAGRERHGCLGSSDVGTQLFFDVTANTLVHRRSTRRLWQDGHRIFF